MSALGDYIHLLGRNYDKYGVSHKGDIKKEYKYPTARDFLNERLKSIKPIKKDAIEILSNRLQVNTNSKMA
jgi:hypothetical protein